MEINTNRPDGERDLEPAPARKKAVSAPESAAETPQKPYCQQSDDAVLKTIGRLSFF